MNVAIDDDVDRARDLMRHFIALYVGGMGSRDKNFYNQLVQRYGFEDAAREIQDLYLDGKKDEAAAAIPPELIDTVALVGPRDRVRERLAVYRDAGVGTLIAAPMAFDPAERRADGPRARGDALSRRFLVAAFGDPGHAFPAIALGRGAGAARPRGHARDVVALAGGRRARGDAVRAPRRSTRCSPSQDMVLKPYVAAVRASGSTREVIRECDPTWWWRTSSRRRRRWRRRRRDAAGPR